MSDMDILKTAPSLVCRLTQDSLKDLLSALSGPNLTTRHRYIWEREVKTKLQNTSSESLLKAASILRRPSSYRIDVVFKGPHVKVFPELPRSILDATHLVFKHIDKFPTCVLVEILRILSHDSESVQEGKPRIYTLRAIHRIVSVLLESIEEVPSSIERALYAISLSARILFNDDGGLTEILRPLSAEQLSLENAYLAAFSQLDKMGLAELIKLGNTFGMEFKSPFNKVKKLVCNFFFSSIHCIYDGCNPPEQAMEALSMIRGVSLPVQLDKGNISTALWKKVISVQRIEAEVHVVLEVSAQVRRVFWDCYEAFTGNEMETRVQHEISRVANIEELSNSLRKESGRISSPGLDLKRTMGDQPAVADEAKVKVEDDYPPEFVTNSIPEKATDLEHVEEEIENISDEVAAAAYVLVDHLLERISSDANYSLQSGSQKSCKKIRSISGAKYSTVNHSIEKLVLDIAEECRAFPKSVIQESEFRLGECSEVELS